MMRKLLVIIFAAILIIATVATPVAAANPAPTVTSISPGTGAIDTGTVNITDLAGAGFVTGATVQLQQGQTSINATSIVVVSAVEITCTFNLSGAATGTWNVVVTNPDNQTGTLTNGFTVFTNPAPTVTYIDSPTLYQVRNGFANNTINVFGSGFRNGATAQLTLSGQPDIPTTGVAVVSGTEITCTFDLTTFAAQSFWNVVVTNTDTQTGTLTGGIQIVNPPVYVASITPNTAPNNGSVTITDLEGIGWGPGIAPIVELSMAGQNPIYATGADGLSGTKLTCTFGLSGAATGVWDVTVAYEGTYTKIGAFTVYQPGLTETSLAVSSSVNPSIYGQSVNFTAAVTPSTATGTVEFSVDDVPFGSPVTISGGSAVLVGITNLSVTTGHTVTARYSGDSTYSGSTGTLSGGQTVTPAPTATSITPNAAVNTGTVNITNLAGTGFLTGAAVQLQKNGQNPIGATSVVVVTESQITCNFDLTGALAGAWNVVVINPDTQTATLANGFTVYSVSQKWYLDNKGDYVMEKTGTQTGSVSISNGSNAIWLSDQQAATDVTFSSGTWTVNLKTDADWSGTCSAQVGDYNAGTSKFTPFNSSPGTGAYSNGVITITVTTGGTVSAGDYLALKIFNNSGALHNITTDGSSWLSSPVTDPGYPLPEMPALVLLGIGLVGLGGYVYVKKSRNDRFAKG